VKWLNHAGAGRGAQKRRSPGGSRGFGEACNGASDEEVEQQAYRD